MITTISTRLNGNDHKNRTCTPTVLIGSKVMVRAYVSLICHRTFCSSSDVPILTRLRRACGWHKYTEQKLIFLQHSRSDAGICREQIENERWKIIVINCRKRKPWMHWIVQMKKYLLIGVGKLDDDLEYYASLSKIFLHVRLVCANNTDRQPGPCNKLYTDFRDDYKIETRCRYPVTFIGSALQKIQCASQPYRDNRPGNGCLMTNLASRPRSLPICRTSSLWKSLRGSTTLPCLCGKDKRDQSKWRQLQRLTAT